LTASLTIWLSGIGLSPRYQSNVTNSNSSDPVCVVPLCDAVVVPLVVVFVVPALGAVVVAPFEHATAKTNSKQISIANTDLLQLRCILIPPLKFGTVAIFAAVHSVYDRRSGLPVSFSRSGVVDQHG